MKLKEARTTRLLTVSELAKKSGVSIPAINKIEQGLSMPSLKTIRKLKRVLKYEPSEIEEFKKAIERRGK